MLVGTSLYGVSYSGNMSGAFFRLNPPTTPGGAWTENILYQFKGGAQGGAPSANPIYLNGSFYGTTVTGGTGYGTVYVLSPTGSGGYTHTVIYSFAGGTDGIHPSFMATLNGNLYGITSSGGAFNNGVVFQLVGSGTTWTESIIHSFNSPVDGAGPQFILTYTNLLYISLASGGAGNGGSVVQLTPPVSGTNWAEDVIYAFGSSGTAAFHPEGFTFGPTDGNLYGVQQVGGGGSCLILTYSGCGGIYKLTNQDRPIAWKFQQLYTYAGAGDSDAPVAPPFFDAAGNMLVNSTGLATSPGSSGAILELTHQTSGWVGSILHTFSGTDGDDPAGGLAVGADGNLYGFTVHGGTGNKGTTYSIIAP